jgi:multiple sugar transport system substrate-binding protein
MTGPAPPDVVVLSSSDLVATYHEQGLVEPLDGWIEETSIDLGDLYRAPLAQCQAEDGTTLCLPWGCDVDALFWNKDLFQAAGLDPERPPQTLEELAAFAERLTVRDGEGELRQVGFVPDWPRPHTALYAGMLGGSGANEASTALVLGVEAVSEAERWQRTFYDRYGGEEVAAFVSSFDHYAGSRHPVYAGRRLACQQCHRGVRPGGGDRLPDRGFYEGKVAMMVSGQWQAWPDGLSRFRPELSYGVAPVPPPGGAPGRARTVVVEGAVIVLPAGAVDKAAAAGLLAWMTSPEVVAEAAYAYALLPASRAAAQDPHLQGIPHVQAFVELLDNPRAGHVAMTPVRAELNEALRELEAAVLHEGGDLAPLLSALQGELAYQGGP